MALDTSVASFTKEVNSGLAKRPLVFNGRLANHGLTTLVEEATDASLRVFEMGHTKSDMHFRRWIMLQLWSSIINSKYAL